MLESFVLCGYIICQQMIKRINGLLLAKTSQNVSKIRPVQVTWCNDWHETWIHWFEPVEKQRNRIWATIAKRLNTKEEKKLLFELKSLHNGSTTETTSWRFWKSSATNNVRSHGSNTANFFLVCVSVCLSLILSLRLEAFYSCCQLHSQGNTLP